MNGRIGIVLSGWAPAMTLMSGAMLGFIDAGIEFEVISTAGVGALIGLLSLAPKHGSPKEALAELPNLFVSDILYAALPINFKVFHKFGPFAKPMHDLRNRVPRIKLDPKASSPFGRLLNDWVDLAFCAMTPSTFEPKSAGLMSPGPEIDDLVNFTALRGAARSFYLNAFNLDERTLEIFDNATTNADAYRAAEALPLLFAPQRMANGDLYTTGGDARSDRVAGDLAKAPGPRRGHHARPDGARDLARTDQYSRCLSADADEPDHRAPDPDFDLVCENRALGREHSPAEAAGRTAEALLCAV